MGLIAKATGGGADREPIPEGVYRAVCYAVYDLGTHETSFEGHVKDVRRVMIAWELPDERMDWEKDGETVDAACVISAKYTLSLHKKAKLRGVLECWRGQAFTDEELAGFDVTKLLGACCQVQVVHSTSKDGSRTYANVAAVIALPKGTKKFKAENAHRFFSFDDDANCVLDDTIPEWVQGIIKDSGEWKALEAGADPATTDAADETGGNTTDVTEEDNLPF